MELSASRSPLRRQVLRFVVAIGLLAAAVAAAAEGPSVRRLADDVFVAGRDVVWREATPRDALLAGQSVDARGKVGGDALIAGRRVAISATIGQDLYAAGGWVRVSGTVTDSARIAGASVTIAPAATLGGGATVAGGHVLIDGRIDRYATVVARSVRVNGEIDGDLTVTGSELALGPHAVVQGRLRYHGEQPPQISDGAQVQGGIEQLRATPAAPSFTGVAGWALLWTLGWGFAGAVLLIAAPRVSHRVTRALRSRPVAAPLLGVLLVLALPLAIALLMVSVIGVPLGIISILLYVVLIPLGYLASAAALGDWAVERRGGTARTARRVVAMAVALLVLFALVYVPYVGWITLPVTVWFGVGAIALAFVGGRRQPLAVE